MLWLLFLLFSSVSVVAPFSRDTYSRIVIHSSIIIHCKTAPQPFSYLISCPKIPMHLSTFITCFILQINSVQNLNWLESFYFAFQLNTHTRRAIDGGNPSIVFMQKREVKGEEENDNDSDDEETIPFSLIYVHLKHAKIHFFASFYQRQLQFMPIFLSFSFSPHIYTLLSITIGLTMHQIAIKNKCLSLIIKMWTVSGELCRAIFPYSNGTARAPIFNHNNAHTNTYTHIFAVSLTHTHKHKNIHTDNERHVNTLSIQL